MYPLTQEHVLELAKREIAQTVGLDCEARFYLAGGVYKSLLTGKPPKDLDVWPASESDRVILIEHLIKECAVHSGDRAYTDEFTINGRALEVKKHMKPEYITLDGAIDGFDLVLSAIGVEHLGLNRWRAYIHPKAWSSYQEGEVVLLDDLKNWKHSLATLVRMRKYADELNLMVPEKEVQKIWSIFESCDLEMKLGMLENFKSSAHYSSAIENEARSRLNATT